MADNPFSVNVVNPLQALMLGQQSYASGIESNKKQAQEAARADAAALYQAGDTRGALAKLLSGGDLQGAGTYSTLDNNAWTRQHTTERDSAADRHQRFMENIALRQANRADEGVPEKAADRAKAASQYGLTPDNPAFKSFVLTGQLPDAGTSFQATIEQRKQAAVANGLDPSSPGFQSFVLTGKMPREDAQPLTATDKKAILEADEMVLSNQAAIDALRKAKEISPKAFSGPFADKRGYAASFLGESSDIGKAGIATTDLNNLVTSNALSQLKAIFGGAPTEGERKILLDIQGAASQPDSVRQKIFDRAVELANKRLEFNKKRAEELRGNQYYKPQGSMSRAPVAQTQGITQQQYEALPSGSVFTAPDGTQRIKP
jgi:hypothetical protein